MRIFKVLVCNDLTEASILLNQMNKKDVKIECVDRIEGSQRFDILYSYDGYPPASSPEGVGLKRFIKH